MALSGNALRLNALFTLLPLFQIFTLGLSYSLPRETRIVAVPFPALVDWPLAPTPTPSLPDELRRRQFNTVCGYIGGNPDLPATCSAGSHCVADVKHGAIGCCPDSGSCTVGIYTGCVDANNPPKGPPNSLVYTCDGGAVCYKNTFQGGFFQYGCGFASDLATTVATTASGKTGLVYSKVSGTYSIIPTRLSGSDVTSHSSSEHSSTSSDGQSSATSLAHATPTNAANTTAADTHGSTTSNIGAIVGGTIAGLAVIFVLAGLAFWLWRRKRRDNSSHKPLSQNNDLNSPFRNNEKAERQPLNPSLTDSELMINPRPAPQPPTTGLYKTRPLPEIPSTSKAGTSKSRDSVVLNRLRAGNQGTPALRQTKEPPRHLNNTPGGLRDGHPPNDSTHNLSTAYPIPRRSAGGPLWQQNRSRSRRLVWR